MPVIIENKELKELNTFGIPARARYYSEFATLGELKAILASDEARDNGWYILGGGSNVLFKSDYEGVIIHPVSNNIEITGGDDSEFVTVRADAGVNWGDFVDYCVDNGYSGAENLSAIPGTVGASPIQNIGAYGADVKDIISSVRVYFTDNDWELDIPASECGFGYRDSIFKRQLKGRAVILSVDYTLSLTPGFNLGYGDVAREVESLGGISLKNVSAAVKNIRNSKLPDPKKIGNSGSFFKNPVVEKSVAEILKAEYPDMPSYPAGNMVKLAAGWLIDKTGWKGFRKGDAGVHDRQALVLVNYGNATGNDILALADDIVADVKSKFGVELEKEVNVL